MLNSPPSPLNPGAAREIGKKIGKDGIHKTMQVGVMKEEEEGMVSSEGPKAELMNRLSASIESDDDDDDSSNG